MRGSNGIIPTRRVRDSGEPEMQPIQLGRGENPSESVTDTERFIAYSRRATKSICLHLEKLDGLPLDNHFDFRMYFDGKEFVYIGEASDSARTCSGQD